MRMRKKKNLIPRMERCAAVQIRTPEDHKGRWAEEFSPYREIRLELGCGKGRFAIGMAELHPDINFIAVEREEGALIMAAEGNSADNWKPVLDYYHALLGFLGWQDRGQVLAGGVFEAGAVAGQPVLDQAFRFGASL